MSGTGQYHLVENMNAGAVAIGANSTAIGQFYEHSPSRAARRDSDQATARALLVVAAEVERDAVLAAVKRVNNQPLRRDFITNHTIYRLGRISHTEVTVAHVAQGTVTPDSAGPAIPELLAAVDPQFVILVGICYGLKENDPRRPQRLGDVLIASELRLIAHRKLAAVRVDRGGAVHPSATLLDRLRTAAVDWPNPAKVHIGQMVSESVLVNSASYRRQISKAYPEAIGGEMEGAAVYAAAVRCQTRWGVVKAICDWGYAKSDEFQQLAAANAASLVTHMIGIGGLDPVEPMHSRGSA
jgi:nucleoside phosphorylase